MKKVFGTLFLICLFACNSYMPPVSPVYGSYDGITLHDDNGKKYQLRWENNPNGSDYYVLYIETITPDSLTKFVPDYELVRQ